MLFIPTLIKDLFLCVAASAAEAWHRPLRGVAGASCEAEQGPFRRHGWVISGCRTHASSSWRGKASLVAEACQDRTQPGGRKTYRGVLLIRYE